MSSGEWEIKVDNIDTRGIFGAAMSAMRQGLQTWLDIVAEDARNKAPVRRVFRDQMHRRRTAWRTVYAGKGAAASVLGAYNLMSGMTNSGQGIRTRPGRGGVTNVQVRSWKPQGPTERRHRASFITSKEQTVGSVRMMGQNVMGARGITSRARWALTQAMRNWRDPGEGRYRTTESSEWNEQGRATGYRSRTEQRAEGPEPESMVTTVLKKPRGSKHVEANVASAMTTGAAATIQMGGTLRRSIHAVRPEINGTTISGKVVASASYAKFVEYGTVTRGRAQPFLRPALHQHRRQLPRSVGSDLRHVVVEGGKA